MFGTPVNKELKNKWVASLTSECQIIKLTSGYFKVCELHFTQYWIEREYTLIDKDGNIITCPYTRPQLKSFAVPKQFSRNIL